MDIPWLLEPGVLGTAPLGGIVDEPDIPPIAARRPESFGLVILGDALTVSLSTGR
jgi:hypothetical protein